MQPRLTYRIAAIAEAVTWTLLIAGMLQKYVFEAGEWGVSIGGAIHGFVFLAYVVAGVVIGINQHWSFGLIAMAVASAIVPYATIPFERWLERHGRLEGSWRLEESDDPRDKRWIDRLLRWFLNRPVLLLVLAVIAVAAVFSGLLLAGPPGGE